MMGSAADASWASVARLGVAVVLLGVPLVWWARELDLLALGEDVAAALGVNAERSARRIFLVSSWLAAATVASAGLVGFVGLVVPNLARALGARSSREMLVLSALLGALLMIGADVVARTVRAPADLPLGAVHRTPWCAVLSAANAERGTMTRDAERGGVVVMRVARGAISRA